MSVILRPSKARGHAMHGWLNSRHSFSFGSYYDPSQMGFRSLRVINEDIINGGSGFPTHPHQDMEIISYVVSGALAHRDSTGSEGVIRRGDVQAMSAGTGVRHSEFNHLPDEETRFLQIWIMPQSRGTVPRYSDMSIPDDDKHNRLRLMVGPKPSEDSLWINQDVLLYGCLIDSGRTLHHPLGSGRGAWVQVVDGAIAVNGNLLTSGDGLQLEEVSDIDIAASVPTEFLLFDLA